MELGGVAPNLTGGGTPTITGLAQAGTSLYAISNAGGLFEITAAELGDTTSGRQGPIGSYVATATDLIGIPFTSLTDGPDFLQNGVYDSLLFGVDTGGILYAFNTRGELQPVFAVDAAALQRGSSVQTVWISASWITTCGMSRAAEIWMLVTVSMHRLTVLATAPAVATVCTSDLSPASLAPILSRG